MRFLALALLSHVWLTQHLLYVVESFGVTHTTTTTTLRITTSLVSSSSSLAASISSPDHIKRVGGGISLVPPGDLQLFDPEEQGKLQGTHTLQDRIQAGSTYQPSSSSSRSTLTTTTVATAHTNLMMDTQHWLEDIGVPLNIYKPTSPGTAVVLGRQRLITATAPGDIQHVVLQVPNDFLYVEGQSVSIIPPGIDHTNGGNKPYKPRLYSIASTRYGDLLDGTTVSLCVRRAEYMDPVTAQVDPTKQGICSHFLCNAAPGTLVQMAGPIGKTMLLPTDPTTDLIMVATGTGIAPFRAFLHRLFMERTVARHMFQATAWLILGVPTTGGLLYAEEFAAMQQHAAYSGQLEVSYAISREMTNAAGGKCYVQDILMERADELFTKLLDKGAVIYFCGLKGMMPGILEALALVAAERGMDWSQTLKQLQANHQWHVEVY